MVNVPEELKNEIWDYCKLNNITNVDQFTINLLKQGFAVEKYGTSPMPPQIIEKEVIKEVEPTSHYAENMTPIGEIQWRKRAHVQGKVTSIKSAPRGSAPYLQVEVWDQSGGVTLQFLGRREIAGLDVGSEIRAEGMVGEEEGSLTILNPSYELLV